MRNSPSRTYAVERSERSTALVTPSFTVKVFHLGNELDPDDTNVDIRVDLKDGASYTATMVTLANVDTIMRAYETSDECAHGTYFWAADLILVRALTLDTIVACVQGLIDEDEIASAMTRVPVDP